MTTASAVKVFICYAREDEVFRQGLEKHLRVLRRQGLIAVWQDRDISPGAEWEREIDIHLSEAHLVLLLISSDFIDSDYCYGIEMKQALKKHEQGEATVIPVILRPVYWQETPFGKLQALPQDATPVDDRRWHSRDEAFFNVAEGIRKVVEMHIRKADEEQASKAQEKEALQADGTLLIRQAEAQPVRSAFDLELPHSGEKKQKAVDEQVSKVEEALEKPADPSENQQSLFARQFLRPSNKSTAPLTFSRFSQNQSLRRFNDPSGQPPQLVPAPLNVKTRDEFLEEALGALAEPYIPWFTAFALLAGLGIGTATIIRSSVPYPWLWSMGMVLVVMLLIYLTAYRKVVHISIMIIIALLSAAGAAGLAAYTSTFIYPSETSNLFLFGFSQKVSLDRQLYIGFIVGGGMGLLASVGGTLTEGLDDPWDLIWGSNLWGAIIWLGLSVLAFLVKWVSRVEWEFGFGYGWDISLMAAEAAILTSLGITYWLRLWIKGAKVKIV